MKDNFSQSGNAAAVIETMRDLHVPTVIAKDEHGHPLLVAVPKGMQLQSTKKLADEFLDRPERAKGKATFTTLETFIEYVKRHKLPTSLVFCNDINRAAPQVEAIFDAHGGNTEEKQGDPDWQEFRALYTLPMSDEWKAWTKISKEEVDQVALVNFLEDRITDVLSPADAGEVATRYAQDVGTSLATAARLMELARGLTINSSGKAQQTFNPTTGEASVIFVNEHKDAAGAPLNIPGAFAIGIPVFRGGDRWTLPVRLRLRVDRNDNNKPYWSLTLQRIDPVLDLALDGVVTDIVKKTELPVYRGTPG